MASPSFLGDKLRVARSFNGRTLAELAQDLSISKQFLGYVEQGHKQPTDLLQRAISDLLGFEPEFFGDPLTDEFRDEECAFRRRKDTAVSVRKRILAHGTLFANFVARLDATLNLPKDSVPAYRAGTRDEIEKAADSSRKHWGLPTDAPIKNVTRVLERAGVIVTKFRGSAEKVDAFSRARPETRKIIVLNTDKDSGSRSRYDVVHEAGHLILHSAGSHDVAEVEKQANQFAAAFLLPRSVFMREFPRSSSLYLDWDGLFRLKRRWLISVGAIVVRAFDLGLINALQYQRAYKYIHAKGWHRKEPDEFEPENPELIQIAFSKLPSIGLTHLDFARCLHWKRHTLEKVTGIEFEKAEVVDLTSEILKKKTSRS